MPLTSFLIPFSSIEWWYQFHPPHMLLWSTEHSSWQKAMVSNHHCYHQYHDCQASTAPPQECPLQGRDALSRTMRLRLLASCHHLPLYLTWGFTRTHAACSRNHPHLIPPAQERGVGCLSPQDVTHISPQRAQNKALSQLRLERKEEFGLEILLIRH